MYTEYYCDSQKAELPEKRWGLQVTDPKVWETHAWQSELKNPRFVHVGVRDLLIHNHLLTCLHIFHVIDVAHTSPQVMCS